MPYIHVKVGLQRRPKGRKQFISDSLIVSNNLLRCLLSAGSTTAEHIWASLLSFLSLRQYKAPFNGVITPAYIEISLKTEANLWNFAEKKLRMFPFAGSELISLNLCHHGNKPVAFAIHFRKTGSIMTAVCIYIEISVFQWLRIFFHFSLAATCLVKKQKNIFSLSELIW